MPKSKLLCLFFSLFFLMSISSVFAFENFNYNPDFTTDYNGYAILEYGTNTSSSLTWCYWLGIPYPCVQNTTNYFSCYDIYSNTTNTSIVFEPSSRCNWFQNLDSEQITLKMLSTSDTTKSTDVYNLATNTTYWCDQEGVQPSYCGGFQHFVLPKGKEGIVFLQYRHNDTNVSIVSDCNVINSKISIRLNGLTEINSTTLSCSVSDGLINKTLFIAPDQYNDRNITIYATFYFGYPDASDKVSGAMQLEIRRFAFYTLDLEDSLSAVFSLTYAQEKCNTTNTFKYSFTNYTGSITENQTMSVTIYTNGTNSAIDGLACGIFQENNSVWVRRILYQSLGTGADKTIQWAMARDIGYTYENIGGTPPQLYRTLWKQVQTYGLKYSCHQEGTVYGNVLMDCFPTFSGSGILNQTEMWKLCIANGYDNYLYQPNNVSGTSWYINCNTGDSVYFPVFSNKCVNEKVCSGNQLFYKSSDCSITFLQNCTFGCGIRDCLTETIEGIELNNYGSFCSKLDNYTYLIFNSSGAYPNTCVFPQKCYQITTTTIQCMNETEYNTTYNPNITNTSITNFITNPASATASLVGGLFGLTDLPLAKNISSILFSLIGSFGFCAFLMLKTKKHDSSSIIQLFSISFISLLTMFTILGWFNVVIYVLLLVLDGFIIVKMSGVMGG